ncbi:MAG: FkbM family methyltransferase [Chloroflexi bacterium]|nr:FkbM family methyltransferase [Chloroflexota bacterium]
MCDARCAPGQTFVDVEANVGYYSAIAASRVGTNGTVWAFEPVPWLHKRLINLAELALTKGYTIQPQQVALADKPGRTTLWTSQVDNIGWNTIVPGKMPEKDVDEAIDVEVQTIDHFFANPQVKPPDVVKIDVEFGEPAVLDGMSGLFESGLRPTLICEVSQKTVKEVMQRLEPLGYKSYVSLKDGRLRPVSLPLPYNTVTWVFAIDS